MIYMNCVDGLPNGYFLSMQIIGNNNPRFRYEMIDKNYNTVNIEVVDHEKDLAVIFQENLKFDLHISFLANKANSILGLI